LSQFVKRNHISIWNWIEWYKPKKILQKKRRVSEFIIDETLLKVGELCLALGCNQLPTDTIIVLSISISIERNMLVAEQFIQRLATEYGKHPVRTDGSGAWYPQACKFLGLDHHHLHSSFEKKHH
jgi:putative transposase